MALKLLTNGFVDRISLNDIDRSIYCFWHSVLRNPDAFCVLLEKTPVTIAEWWRQKAIWQAGDSRDRVALGFSFYFLNRTNRSGIIEGAGPIGGYRQAGKWKIDVRLVKEKQIDNIRMLTKYAQQITISNKDALVFLAPKLKDKNLFVYLDPPYFVKERKLYKNFYEARDHRKIAQELKRRRKSKWVVSYDDVPEIRKEYAEFASRRYSLNYSAGEKSIGTEAIFASDVITLPKVATP